MDHQGPMAAREIESALRRMLEAYPDAGVAAVRANGLFSPVPAEAGVTTHHTLEARAGIELVAPESRALVLEQFRQIGERGASEIEVRLASGNPGRYALFDIRETFGIVMLVVIEGEPDGSRPLVSLPDVAPVRPRYGRVKRSETGQLLDVDDEVLGLLGYSREAFAAHDSKMVHEDDYPILVGQWFDLLTAPTGSSRRVRSRYRRSDGSWLWLELTLTRHPGDDESEAYVMMELVDISDEMAAMDQVWQSRELLRRLTEALPVGVLQIDADCNVVYTNDRLHQIVGVPQAESLKAQLQSIVSDDAPALKHAVERVLATGTGADIELRFHPDGVHALRYAQLAIRALRDRAETVTGAILCVTDVTDSTLMRQELELRASSDTLTGCFNRSAVMSEIERVLGSDSQGTAVVFVDLDGFKPINDRLGHAAGDELLRAVAGRLQGAVRTGDVVGRLGGDEFIVLCPGVASRELAAEIGERIADAVHFDAPVGARSAPIRASIGVAWTTQARVPAEALVAAADAAMYESKRAGGNRAVVAG